jgi:V8-like Glu-specific endopeptidase
MKIVGLLATVFMIATSGAAIARQAATPAVEVGQELPAGVYEDANGRLMFESGPPAGAETVTFVQVAPSTTKIQVMGGDGSYDARRMPATFKATFADKSVCTATLIGPLVILTAAHCVDARKKNAQGVWQTIVPTLKLAKQSQPGSFKACVMAKAYLKVDPPPERKPRNSSDFALCELVDDPGVLAESIDQTSASIAKGVPVLLAGYGCTEKDLRGDRIPNFVASSTVLNVGANVMAEELYKGWSTSIGRVGQKNQAIICPGDSGGAVFFKASLAPGQDGKRRVSAVNSAVGPSPAQKQRWLSNQASPDGAEYISYFSALSDPAFAELLSEFMADNDRRAVCGVNVRPSTRRCRAD